MIFFVSLMQHQTLNRIFVCLIQTKYFSSLKVWDGWTDLTSSSFLKGYKTSVVYSKSLPISSMLFFGVWNKNRPAFKGQSGNFKLVILRSWIFQFNKRALICVTQVHQSEIAAQVSFKEIYGLQEFVRIICSKKWDRKLLFDYHHKISWHPFFVQPFRIKCVSLWSWNVF